MPRAALAFLGAALLGRLSAPEWPGFWFVPLALGLILAALAGPKAWRAHAAALLAPAGRAGLRLAAGLALGLAAALAAGQAEFGPAWDLSGRRNMALAPATLAIMASLDRPATLVARLGPQDPRAPWIKELLGQFQRAAGAELKVVLLNPLLEAGRGAAGPELANPGSALITADAFREEVPALTEEALRQAFSRLTTARTRLVYVLSTFGSKTVQSASFGGLSQWAADLGSRRLMALDYYWPEGSPLPDEAAALVLAGPRAPLGEEREKRLLEYLARGGRLLIMADPLTAAFSPDFWKPFGLAYPEGLVVDPETSLGGTSELFIVSRDYPEHPLTGGLGQPVLWPLAGAFIGGGEEAKDPVYILAQSSPSAWLQLDAAAAGRGEFRYRKGQDPPGPLALGVAVELSAGGGRLAALADSDLAANGFWGFPGNRAFCGAIINWLLDGRSPGPQPEGPGQSLILSDFSARLAFWLPVAAWPAAILGAWAFFYRRRRG